MGLNRLVVALFATCLAVPVEAQVMPLDEAAKVFGTRESIQSMRLSPNGNRLMLLSSGPGRTTVIKMVELPGMNVRAIMASPGDPESFRWCDFATDTQLICRYTGNGEFQNSIVSVGRLVTLDTDGKEMKELGQRSSFYDAGLRQFDGAVLDWLPAKGAILMERSYVPEAFKMNTRIVREKHGLGVDRIELPSLKTVAVEQPNKDASNFMGDGRGEVRLMETAGSTAGGVLLSGKFRYFYRKKGSDDWNPLGEYDASEESGIRPLAVDADADAVYFLRKLDGRNALYRRALNEAGADVLVASDKQVDIDDVVRFGHGQRVIGYTFATEQRHAVYFDPEFRKLADSLEKALPNQPLIDFVSSSSDGSKLLIFAGSDTSPGTYYLFDRNSRSLNELALARPELEGKKLASVRPTSFPGPDGTQVPAYLTLPPGKEAKGLPAIVLPHGGPSARDEWGFDWLAQFLASRGYAVIQPNFRGSAGYGDDWLSQNGFRDWKLAIGDINAAARHLVAQGIADPARLAIVGWSYGGYAALQSVAMEPTLYKASVAIAPVTDLSLLKQDAQAFTNSKLVSEFVGSGDHIAAGSPLRNADRIKVPVLLVHGDLDANVTIAHSERMAAALSQAELLRYKGLDHFLEDSNARVEMLTRIGQLLDRSFAN